MKKVLLFLACICSLVLITGGGIVQKRPRAYSPTETPSGSDYTELTPIIITPTGTTSTFNDYDVFTNHSIPKGSVLDLMVCNYSTTTTEGGARNDGSSLSRYLDLTGYYSTSIGYMSARFICTVDSSSGNIELYSENNSNIRFIIIGYWGSGTYTERFDTITVTSGTDNQFTDINLNTLFSTPVSRVYDVAMGHAVNGARNMGVRANGSSLSRLIDVPNSFGGGATVLNMFVKADASGIIEIYLEVYNQCTGYSMGYWDSSTDYEERFDDITPTSDSTWNDKDLTSYVSSPLFVEVLGLKKTTGTHTLGVRSKDSSTLTRTIAVGNGGANTTQYGGATFTSNLDADDILQVYSTDYVDAQFYHAGYFK
jgi:hypothetical protein